MNCKVCMDWASEYIEGALPPQQTSHMQAHLDACPACAGVISDVRRIMTALGALRRITPSAAFDFVLRGIIRRELNRSKHRKARLFKWLTPEQGIPLSMALFVAFMVFFSVLTIDGLWQHFSARRGTEMQNGILSLNSSISSGENVTNHYVLERTTLEALNADTVRTLRINHASIDTSLFATESRETVRNRKVTLVTF